MENSSHYPKGGCAEEVSLFTHIRRNRTGGNGPKFCQGRSRSDVRKYNFSESCQTLDWAAQGGGEVTINGGVQETFRCYTEGNHFMEDIGDRWTVGLDDLRGIFQSWQFCDSMVQVPAATLSPLRWYATCSRPPRHDTNM